MRYRSVNFKRFNRFVTLLLGRHSVDSAHIVQSVCKLYYNNAYILPHCNKHFAKTFCLLLLFGGKVKTAYFCNSVYKQCYLFSELALNILKRCVGILYNVVQERGGNCLAVHSEGDDYKSHVKRVRIIRLARRAFLTLVL